MSMLDALQYHGAAGARWVSPTGRLMFASPESGSSISVPSHTFHGGADPEDVVTDAKWWLDPAQLARDDAAMREYFPDFVNMSEDPEHPPAWGGVIDSGFGRFPVLILHRQDHGLPRVVPVRVTGRSRQEGRRTVKSPHLYDSGHLCIADEADWNSQRDTIATVVAWTAHWHACYVSWRLSGVWPASGVAVAA